MWNPRMHDTHDDSRVDSSTFSQLSISTLSSSSSSSSSRRTRRRVCPSCLSSRALFLCSRCASRVIQAFREEVRRSTGEKTSRDATELVEAVCRLRTLRARRERTAHRLTQFSSWKLDSPWSSSRRSLEQVSLLYTRLEERLKEEVQKDREVHAHVGFYERELREKLSRKQAERLRAIDPRRSPRDHEDDEKEVSSSRYRSPSLSSPLSSSQLGSQSVAHREEKGRERLEGAQRKAMERVARFFAFEVTTQRIDVEVSSSAHQSSVDDSNERFPSSSVTPSSPSLSVSAIPVKFSIVGQSSPVEWESFCQLDKQSRSNLLGHLALLVDALGNACDIVLPYVTSQEGGRIFLSHVSTVQSDIDRNNPDRIFVQDEKRFISALYANACSCHATLLYYSKPKKSSTVVAASSSLQESRTGIAPSLPHESVSSAVEDLESRTVRPDRLVRLIAVLSSLFHL